MGAFGGRCFTGFGSLISLGSFGRIGFITFGLGAETPTPPGPESTASACAAADCCGSRYACCMPGKTWPKWCANAAFGSSGVPQLIWPARLGW